MSDSTELGYVYFFLNINDNSIKIGFTKDIEKRRRSLSTGSSGKLALLGYIRGNMNLEKQLHTKFQCNKIRNNGEWFSPSEDLLLYINENNNIYRNWVEIDNGKVRIYTRIKK